MRPKGGREQRQVDDSVRTQELIFWTYGLSTKQQKERKEKEKQHKDGSHLDLCSWSWRDLTLGKPEMRFGRQPPRARGSPQKPLGHYVQVTTIRINTRGSDATLAGRRRRQRRELPLQASNDAPWLHRRHLTDQSR